MSEATHEHHADQPRADEHGVAHYNKIILILVALAFVSFLGPMVGIKWLTLTTAFGIALVKAYLVITNFMHLNIEKRYITYLLSTAILLMLLFFAAVAPDVMRHRGRGWENVGAQVEVRRALAAHASGTDGEHGAH